MTTGKEKFKEQKPDIKDSERSLRDDAEVQLARSQKRSADLKGQTPEQLIHELQVHQIELETQAEELRRAHLALEESRDKYLDLYDFAPLGYVILTDKGLIAEANLSCATLLGVERGNLVRAPFSKFMSEKDSDQWYRHFVNVLKHGEKQTCTFTLTRSDGSIFPARLESIRLTCSEGTITVRTAISDITDIWQIEALRESDEKIRLLLNSTAEAIYGLDMDGNCTFCNSACLNLLGYQSPDELLGRNMHWQIHAKYQDGTHFPVEECRIFQAFNKGEGTHVDDEVLWRSDGTSFPAEYWSYPQRRDGVVIGAVVTFLNITERKIAEDALLRVNQKLNVITNLTRQDLTNQLFVLKSYLEITKKNAAGQDRILEGIQKSEKAICSISEITEFTKDYQDMGAKPPKWQNVKMTMLLGLSHISISKIQHSLETENLEIFADPLLEKVCQRLFENSVKHGDHVTRIRVWHSTTPDGATIFFEDDGVGILPEMKEQIFLRSDGHRASMRSLFFVREILDITGIIIKETGEPGTGARFEMTVPKGAWRITGNGA